MLHIHIDDPELEKSIKQVFGEDARSIASAFSEFIKQLRIRQDIGISIELLAAGESLPLNDVMDGIRAKYE